MILQNKYSRVRFTRMRPTAKRLLPNDQRPIVPDVTMKPALMPHAETTGGLTFRYGSGT